MSSFTMLYIVNLALMAIGATAQTLDSLATAGCVDQSAEFLSGLATKHWIWRDMQ